jgi:hypothetical protein
LLTNVTRVPGLTVMRCGLTPLAVMVIVVPPPPGVVVVVVEAGAVVVVVEAGVVVVVVEAAMVVVVDGVGAVGVLPVPLLLLPPQADATSVASSRMNVARWVMIASLY